MKKKRLLTAVLSLIGVAVLASGIFFSIRQYKINEFKKNGGDLPVNFTFTAHTGCMGTDDNSIQSIEVAVANGADIVEFDLNFTDDGEPVLAHDAPKGGEVTLDVTVSGSETALSGAVEVIYDKDVLELVKAEWHTDGALLSTFDKATDKGAFAYQTSKSIS